MGTMNNHRARIAQLARLMMEGVRMIEVKLTGLDAMFELPLRECKKREAELQAEVEARRAVNDYLDSITPPDTPPTSPS